MNLLLFILSPQIWRLATAFFFNGKIGSLFFPPYLSLFERVNIFFPLPFIEPFLFQIIIIFIFFLTSPFLRLPFLVKYDFPLSPIPPTRRGCMSLFSSSPLSHYSHFPFSSPSLLFFCSLIRRSFSSDSPTPTSTHPQVFSQRTSDYLFMLLIGACVLLVVGLLYPFIIVGEGVCVCVCVCVCLYSFTMYS